MRPELRLKSAVAVTCIFVLKLAPVCSDCPYNWNPFHDRCYAYQPETTLTWYDAVTACHHLGSHLLEINSAEENYYVIHLVQTSFITWVWMGINDLEQEGRWVLTTTNQTLEYSNWDEGEPNNNGGEHCGSLYTNGRWNDRNCWSYSFFICERGVSIHSSRL